MYAYMQCTYMYAYMQFNVHVYTIQCTRIYIGSSETSASENGRKAEQAQAIQKVARASGLRRKTLDILPAHTQAVVPTKTQGGEEGPDNDLAAEAVHTPSLSPPNKRGGWGARVEGAGGGGGGGGGGFIAGAVSSSFAYDTEADLTMPQRERERDDTRLSGTVLHNSGSKASPHHVSASSLPTKSPTSLTSRPPHVTQDAAVTQRSSSSHTHTVSSPHTPHTHIVSKPVFPPSPPFPVTRALHSPPRATVSHDVLGGWGWEGVARKETVWPHRLAHFQWDEDEKVFYSSGPNGEA
jgi:hypothetical protein